MSVVARIGFFVTALAIMLAAGYGLGAALDPDRGDDGTDMASAGTGHEEHDMGTTTADGPAAGEVATRPERVEVEGGRFEPGAAQTLRFRVLDRDGRTVGDYDVEHEREMHVIVVRRDLTGYRHIHPRRTADGGWEVDVRFGEPGPHRVFADFSSAGASHTLAADVEVEGDYRPRRLPRPAPTARAGAGYEVEIASDGDERRFEVTRDGRPVDDLEPYLGARGHLVALREGDLAFMHVHAQDAATEGRAIRFAVEFPSRDSYRMFLQFKHDGEVRTAAFTEDGGRARATHGEVDHGH
ncbi:MAG: hypothetical protein WD993_02325 [Thermoleophilaceae bacterium]